MVAARPQAHGDRGDITVRCPLLNAGADPRTSARDEG